MGKVIDNTTPMEKSVNDRQLHMCILKFTQIGSCVDDDMASLQKVLTLPHLLFHRDVFLTLSRTHNYTCYTQSFYWLPIHPVSKVKMLSLQW
jgi:hypothetical protein